MQRTILLGLVVLAAAGSARGGVVDFEDLSLGSESAYYGADAAGGFTSGGAFFNNLYTDFGGGFFAWQGWAYSNQTDATTPGFGNQFSAFAGSGSGGSRNYGVAYAFFPGDAVIELPAGQVPVSIDLVNTTYAALIMRDGDPIFQLEPFGGPDGTRADWFKLTITGLDAADQATGSVDFYLADYRFADSADDYIVSEWTNLDLTSLGAATKLSFGFESSDVGPFGINTPTFVAVDNLVTTAAVPESGTLALVASGLLLIAVRRRGMRS